MTAKELKPCPFCGKNDFVEMLYFDCTYAIWCSDCACGTTYFDSEAEAINKWNNRQYTVDKCKEQREWKPIDYDNSPKGEVLLLTSSKVIVIGDRYKDVWRVIGRCKWVDAISGIGRVLESDFKDEDITHWMPLPDTELNALEPEI